MNISQIDLKYYKNKYQKYFSISNQISSNYDKVYLKESKIHGVGVFANKDFDIGEAITIYPAHYIFKVNEYSIFNIENELTCNFMDYRYDIDNNISIIGNPDLKNNMMLVGHLCNDGYKHNFTISNKKNKKLYNTKSKYANNSTYLKCDNDIVNIISIKKIKKDEEICVSYGFNYWLRYNSELI